jgi:hypothetical protein
VSGLLLLTFFASLGIAIWQYGGTFPPFVEATKSYSAPVAGLERARVQLDFNAGRLQMSSLPAGSNNLVEVDSRSRHGDIKTDFQVKDGEGELHLSLAPADRSFWDEAENEWEVRFARTIPLTLNIKAAVSDMRLDLSELPVTEVQMDLDVGNYEVKMPAAGTSLAFIRAD